jgi:hypothetical protein
VLDEIQTRAEGDSAQAVQQRIQPWQEDPPFGQCGRRMVDVEQPE